MADIQRYLDAIMAAVLGEQVRGSIHDSIDIINKVSEKQIDSGTAIHAGDPAGSYYDKSLYINTQTDELLRCNGSTWVVVDNIRGNGISEITGPVSSGLKDTYTIHYTDGVNVTFDVYNGRGIVRFELTNKSGLIDTYTVTYNDSTTSELKVKNGNQWYSGTEVSGGSSTPTGFTLPYEVKAGDFYLNISDDTVYMCTVGAEANMTSTWVYRLTISSSSTGTNNYGMLQNKPAVNGHTLLGNMTNADLDLDDWLTDGATPPVVIEKVMAVGTSSITFSAADMSVVNTNGWAVKPFFECADGQAPPALKKIVHNVDGSVDIRYSKVKPEQATVKCKLRIVK